MIIYWTSILFTIISTSTIAFSQFSHIPTENLKQYFYDYRGTLGDRKVGMLLGSIDTLGELVGHYFFYDDLKDIPLTGKIIDSNRVVLFEKALSGKEKARFNFYFIYDGPARGIRISEDGQTDSITVRSTGGFYKSFSPLDSEYADSWRYLQLSDSLSDPEIERNIHGFYYAVLADDRETAAKYVHYPLRVNTKPGKLYLIKNKKEFLKKYKQLFNAKAIKWIKEDVPHDLFPTEEGIMIGLGTVWFNGSGYAYAINTVD